MVTATRHQTQGSADIRAAASQAKRQRESIAFFRSRFKVTPLRVQDGFDSPTQLGYWLQHWQHAHDMDTAGLCAWLSLDPGLLPRLIMMVRADPYEPSFVWFTVETAQAFGCNPVRLLVIASQVELALEVEQTLNDADLRQYVAECDARESLREQSLQNEITSLLERLRERKKKLAKIRRGRRYLASLLAPVHQRMEQGTPTPYDEENAARAIAPLATTGVEGDGSKHMITTFDQWTEPSTIIKR